MEKKLSYTERMEILFLLPSKGNMMTLRAAEDLRKRLALTQKEMTDAKMQQEGELLRWDDSKEKPLKVTFTELEMQVIADALKTLDEKEELRPAHLPLYDIFVDK